MNYIHIVKRLTLCDWTNVYSTIDKSSDIYFKEMNILNKNLNLNELSMGMSSDYLDAIKNSATYVRIGSNIFGQRS